jgi:hypothetical protein
VGTSGRDESLATGSDRLRSSEPTPENATAHRGWLAEIFDLHATPVSGAPAMRVALLAKDENAWRTASPSSGGRPRIPPSMAYNSAMLPLFQKTTPVLSN